MVKFTRKRIGLIFAGGTILSDNPGQWEFVKSEVEARRWLDHVPELRVVADVEPVFVTSKDATEIGPEEWLAMAAAVKELEPRVDGIVILHGIETIHYSANALALMIQKPTIPIVLSASPIPRKGSSLGQAEFGARANLIIASQVATSESPTVSIVYGNRIVLGGRAQLEVIDGVLQVISTDRDLMGQVDFGTKYFAGRGRRGRKAEYHIHIDPNVLVTTLVPGSGIPPAERSLLDKVHGVVLRMHQGYFALPDALVKDLDRRAQKGMVVVVSSPAKIASLPKSFVQLTNISASMAVVKTMWALGHEKRTLGSTRALLLKDVAGEAQSNSRSSGKAMS